MKAQSPTPQLSQAEISAHRELLERVAGSRTFQKSIRMRELLVYLGGRTLEQPGCEIREQEIGVAVFARPAHYDTVADTIARVNVYDLRKKLDAHFSTEGLDEPVIISIPKGSYCLEFAPRPGPPASAPETAAAPTRTAPAATPVHRNLWAILCLALLLVSIGLTVRLAQMSSRTHPHQLPPALHALWSRMLTDGRATDLVLADSNLSLLQDLVSQPLPTAEYRSGTLEQRAEAILGESSRRTVET